MTSFFRKILVALLCVALALPMASGLKAAPARGATDTYDYDAFGNLIHSTGNTPNNYLFAGEQFDPDLNLSYNRARYLNTSTGRFWSMDNFEGDSESPSSLHKYLYAGNDPVNTWDRSGNDFDLGSITTGLGIAGTISAISNIAVAGAISAAYGSYPDAVAFGVFVAGEIGSAGNGTLWGIGGYEVVFAPRLMGQRSFWWGGLEPSISEPLSQSGLGNLAHGRHTEVGIFIAWYWNLNDLDPGNFGIYAIAAGTGFYGYEFTPEGATASLTGQILSNSGVPEVGLFSIGGREASASPVLSQSEGALATEVAGYEAAFSAITIASSKGAINPVGGAAATALNAGVGALWVHYTYGRHR